MKMKLMSLGLMMLLSLSVVSAFTIEDAQSDYNKKDNEITFDFLTIQENECAIVDAYVYDHKDNLVGTSANGAWTICLIRYPDGRVIRDFRKTGTFEGVEFVDLIAKKDIKGLGNLRYELVKTYGGEVLATGRVAI